MVQLDLNVCIGVEYEGDVYTIKCMASGITFGVRLMLMKQINPWRKEQVPYQIPEGSTASLRVTRADGAHTNTEATIAEDGMVLCPIHPYSTATPGKCSADVVIYGPDGKRVASATWPFIVDAECEIINGDDTPVFVDSVQELMKTAVDSAARAEDAAKRAEASGGAGGGTISAAGDGDTIVIKTSLSVRGDGDAIVLGG